MAKRKGPSAVSVFLGSDSHVDGVLTFTGQARLDGSFAGSIIGEGSLLIGPQARAEADIKASEIIISGEVIGDVTATVRLDLKAPGSLKGNISAPLVVMDEGVLFEGHCSMPGEDVQERKPKVTLLTSDKKG